MRLRSSQEKADSDPCREGPDAVDGMELSLNCGSESLLDGAVEKRATEAEYKVCINEDADDKPEDKNDGKEVLPLGAKVLDSMENMTGLCKEREIDRERVECVPVGYFTVGVKEGKELVSENLNELDSGLNEEIKSPPVTSATTCQLKDLVPPSTHEEAMECENLSEKVGHRSIVLNTDVVSGHTCITKEKVKVEEMALLDVECKKEGDSSSFDANENGEGTSGLKKRKRGRKRKNFGDQECNADARAKKDKTKNGDVEVSGRVLRSRASTMSGGVKVVDGGLNESVISFKRKMEAECLDETELLKEASDSIQVTCRQQKKQKRRGRPPKVPVGVGFTGKIKAECLDKTELQAEVNEACKQERRGRPCKAHSIATSSILTDEVVVSEKLIRRGRPPKLQGKESAVLEIQKNKHKDMPAKNLKRRGRPPKVQAGNLITLVTNAKKGKHMVVKKNNNQLKAKDVKEGHKIHNVQKEDGVAESINDNKQKVKVKEGNDNPTVEDTAKQSKNSISGPERRKKQQLVRDQIVSMIMKAGWVIEYRPRQGGREYMDAVYVDQNGRTHWSVTKAYHSLKKKVEDGKANSEEVSAFTPIPDEEMNVLFKLIMKVRSDKNTKKIKWKSKSKAKIVISGEAPPKKKPGKKSKDGTKRKQVHASTIKLADKSSGFKVKGDKSRHEHGVIPVPSFQRRPKVSQKRMQSRKPRLVARSSSKGLDQDKDGCIIYSGKRNLFSWMIDLGVIMTGGKVQYREGRKKTGLSEGTVTRDGIHCSCCNEIMDMSNFVSHGGGKLTKALKNIYFQSGSSLSKCLLESWLKEVESSSIRFNYVDIKGDDPNDDTCNICGDGGDLVCCDGCPSTFHQSCLGIQNFPSGDWQCIYCSCKFCGVVSRSASQMDDHQHTSKFEMLSCCLCEEKFHRLCLQEEDAVNVGSGNLSFCGRKCQELSEQLQKYLGVKFELKEGYSWTLLQRSDVSQDSKPDDLQKVECNSKLAVAFSVMDECFVPIMDERSGVNMIHNVVYNCGSNFRRLNYSGFFTAILERGDELISAASIRIHGHRLAEMPFIGTRHMYRRQGMCRRLLDAIEYALGSLGVGELVIPAIPELFKTWTKVFGFKPLEDSKRQTMKCMSMIVFPGTDMLQKPLVNNQFSDKSFGTAAVSDDKPVKGENIFLETRSSNAVDYEQRPASMEEATIMKSDCSVNVLLEVKSSNAVDYEQRPASMEEATIMKNDCSVNVLLKVKSSNAVDYEQRPASMEETTLLKDDCRYPDENATHLKSETPTTTFQVLEPTGVLASDAKSEYPLQHVPSDSDVQDTDDVDREGVGGVKASSSTFKVVPKITFDLNLQPAATDTDLQSLDDNSLSLNPQECKNSTAHIENKSVSLHDPKTCAPQPLVLV